MTVKILKLLVGIYTSNPILDLNYSYDDVNNITQISNVAGYTTSALGGNYTYNYSYDNLYRLTGSTGSFSPSGLPAISQSLSMSYSSSGNILSKQVVATTLENGTTNSVNYNNAYAYNFSKPHTVSSAGIYNFAWDNNGNMIQRSNTTLHGTYRSLCWDEENYNTPLIKGRNSTQTQTTNLLTQ